MDRYAAETVVREGFTVIALTDKHRNSVAELLPEVGNNLYRFASGGHEVVMPPLSLKALHQNPANAFRYGTPMLFPPNRVKDGKFVYGGRTYNLPLNEPPDHHLHGEISTKAWDVVETGASEERGAWTTSRFRYADHPEIMEYFPHPITFTMTYRLHDGKLYLEGSIKNEGGDEAPFAFGLHPYFSVPFDSGGRITLRVPAVEEWPVTNLAFATGKPSATEFCTRVRQGADIGDYPVLGCSLLSLDTNSDRICRIEMADRGYAIAYQLDPAFPFVLLFRPDWAQAYSLEPYTYVTDAFNLPFAYEMTGARGIQAGEECRFTTVLWVESF